MQRITNFVRPVIRYVSRFIWNTPRPVENNYTITNLESGSHSQEPGSSALVSTETISTQKIIARYATFIFSKENHLPIMYASLLTILGTGCNFLAPYILGEMINSMQKQKEEAATVEENQYQLLRIIGLVVVFSLSQLIPNMRDRILVPVTAYNNKKILTAIMQLQLKHSLTYHIATSHSQQMHIVQKAFSSSSVGTPLLTQVAPTLLEVSIASAILTYRFGTSMGAGALAVFAVYVAYCVKTTQLVIDARENMIKVGSKTYNAMSKAIAQYKPMHDFNKFADTMKAIEAAVEAAAEAETQENDMPLKIGVGHIVISRLGMLVAILFAAMRMQTNQLSVSEFMALLGYLNQLSGMLPVVGQGMMKVLSSIPEIKYVFGQFENSTDVVDIYAGATLQLNGPAQIEFRNVTFAYPGKSPTFDNLSLTIKPGQRVAFVSPSGGGKSTLLTLLYGYYQPSSGEIYINGQNIAEISCDSLQKNIVMAGQDANLSNGTVRDNIKYGVADSDAVSDDEIFHLAKKLNLFDFITTLEKQLDTDVGENGKAFSGGQKQKVAIMRSFMKCLRKKEKEAGSICLFDEVTAALDAGSATDVLAGINKMLGNNATQLFITHKLSEITEFDKIIVLDQGVVVAEGIHEELLKNCTLYQTLWEKSRQENGERKNNVNHSSADLLVKNWTSDGILKDKEPKEKESQSQHANVETPLQQKKKK